MDYPQLSPELAVGKNVSLITRMTTRRRKIRNVRGKTRMMKRMNMI
jgi:hypothetical protein